MRNIKYLLLSMFAVLSASSTFCQSEFISEKDFLNQLKNKKDHKIWVGRKADPINIHFDSFDEVDNKISSHGKITDESFSNVMFKVNGSQVFGYILNLKTNKGYLFQSDGKSNVEVSEVSSSEYYHISKIKPGKKVVRESAPMPFPGITSIDYPHIQSYQQGMNLHALESKPGSPNVIFLDWRAVFNGNIPKNLTSEEMYEVWAGTAAGYTCFDVNVTTSPAVYNSVPVFNSCIALFKDFDARSHAPGDSWGTANASTIYTSNTAVWYVNVLVHEIGHQLGLDHDGAPNKEYFGGVAEYDWNSVMGNTWYGDFLQYSKGEYKNADNLEDDFAIITGYIPYRNFEIKAAKKLVFDADQSTINLNDNIGTIGKNTDEDYYEFKITEPKVLNLKIEALEFRTMLDVEAILEDENGNVIIQDNITLARGVEFKDVLLDKTGTYKLIVKGGSEGTPEWGFSTYGSVGIYGVFGEVRSLESKEIRFVKLNPFSEVCNSYAPSVSIKNLGQQTINSIELEILVDNSTSSVLNISNLSIASLASADLELSTLSKVGKDVSLKVMVKKINGSIPNITNDLLVNYTLGVGVSLELNISDEAYSNTSWSIENASGVKILEYENVIVELKEQDEYKMRFCLVEDCYKLKVSHSLESCSNVAQWSSGSNYQAGATVIHQDTDPSGSYYTYTSKWWATSADVPGGGDPWEQTGICTVSSRGEFSLKAIGAKSMLVESNSGDNTDELSFDFCASNITSLNQIKLNEFKVFPNPFENNISVRLINDNIKNVSLYDMNGRMIPIGYSSSLNTSEINLEVAKGIYLLKIIGEKGFYTKLIQR